MADKTPPKPTTAKEAAGGCLTILVLAIVGAYACSHMTGDSSAPAMTDEEITHRIYNKIVDPKRVMGEFVWVSYDAMEKGRRLIEAGVAGDNAEIVMPLIACEVAARDPVTITGGYTFSAQILVTGGKAKGCEGWISRESLAELPKPAPDKPKP